jgi:SAM-dependent methyltransferase
MMAAERGAIVTGLDASAGLLEVARARVPDADFRVGDMSELPFADGEFDVVMTISGIAAGLDRALAEAVRVLRPGGLLGLASWGSPRRREHLAYFMALVEISPREHIDDSMVMMATGRPGVAENMLTGAGMEVLERGEVNLTSEFPDVATAVRAFTAVGSSWPAIQQVGPAKFSEVMTAAIAAVADGKVGVRLSSEFFWLTGRKPR